MDFKAIHQSTLPKMTILLQAIFPAGKLVGREFKIGNLRGDSGESLSVNIDSGVWQDFASGENGGDLTSLLAAKLGYKMTDAGLIVQTLVEDPTAGRKQIQTILSGGINKPPSNSETPVGNPPPTPTADNFILGEWGVPMGMWPYYNAEGRMLFVVCRYGDASSKTYRPWTWDGYRWNCKAYDHGRPLYNLGKILGSPNARVLIVEGEKCADFAEQALGEWFVPVTWAGGAKAVNKSIWSSLAGKHVVIWPDNDPPGYKAGLEIAEVLSKTAQSIKIVNTQELPEGADIADLEFDGASIMAWLDANMIESKTEEPSDKLPTGGEWKAELKLTGNGTVKSTAFNLSLIIQNDPYFSGRWWVEDWDGRFHVEEDAIGEVQVFEARVHLSKVWGIEVTDEMMYKALDATLPRRNTIQQYLTGLQWDGFNRFEILADQVLRLPNNNYVVEVMRLLFTGMVARAMNPGCKYDYCIILRGPQGIGKTLFFEKLGRERYVMLYSRTTQDKDILGAVATGWIVSIEELFDSRASLKELKSMISSTVDTWRKPYHREMQSQPKRCVLVGTTDAGADFLDDMAGYRRFLIIECGKQKFDLNLFEEIRDQLFAEAYHRWKTVPNWFRLTSASIVEQTEITSNWEVEDAWAEPVGTFLQDKDTTTMLEILTNCLFIAPSMHDSRITKRLHRVLVGLGFDRVRLRIKNSNSRLRAYQRRAAADPEQDELEEE